MTKQQQFNQYQNCGGTMTMEEWEQDSRYDVYEEPAVTNMDKLLALHLRCVNAITVANAYKYEEDQVKRRDILAECAEAEAALLRFYDETPSFKIMIIPSC
jgi:hypothetical protein